MTIFASLNIIKEVDLFHRYLLVDFLYPLRLCYNGVYPRVKSTMDLQASLMMLSKRERHTVFVVPDKHLILWDEGDQEK